MTISDGSGGMVFQRLTFHNVVLLSLNPPPPAPPTLLFVGCYAGQRRFSCPVRRFISVEKGSKNLVSPPILSLLVDTEVRAEDQEMINEFGSLNARLQETRADIDAKRKRLEELDDAAAELMMCDDDGDDDDDFGMGGGGGGAGGVSLLLGEAFFGVSEGEATEYCEKEVERLQTIVDKLEGEADGIKERQSKLKKRCVLSSFCVG